MSAYPVFKAAAAHVAPVFLDREKTVAKTSAAPATTDDRVVRFSS